MVGLQAGHPCWTEPGSLEPNQVWEALLPAMGNLEIPRWVLEVTGLKMFVAAWHVGGRKLEQPGVDGK